MVKERWDWFAPATPPSQLASSFTEGAIPPSGRSRPSGKGPQNRTGGSLRGAEVLWVWRRQLGMFLLAELEKGVLSKEAPSRETWRLGTLYFKNGSG